MKRNTTNCRHKDAFPTMIGSSQGYLWCPDCGAIRDIESTSTNQFKAVNSWLYPTGHADVLKQLEKQK